MRAPSIVLIALFILTAPLVADAFELSGVLRKAGMNTAYPVNSIAVLVLNSRPSVQASASRALDSQVAAPFRST